MQSFNASEATIASILLEKMKEVDLRSSQ